MEMDALIVELFEREAIKFGSFTLKSGIVSPVYVDLRIVIAFPKLMRDVSNLLYEKADEASLKYDSVCGVPYTALPLATIISADHDIPMLIRRKEAKDYGTKKQIEGDCKEGSVCLIIEDVVTTGGSVFETTKILKEHKVNVTDAIVLLNREQGGKYNLANSEITLHSVLTLSGVMDVLLKKGKITEKQQEEVKNFIASNNMKAKSVSPSTNLTFMQRSAATKQVVAKKLFEIMERKNTNLCFSADLDSFNELFEVVSKIGKYICCLKTHIDIMEDFSQAKIEQLQALSKELDFLIFEDRKFADIGNTVRSQYSGGIFKICDWSDITNAHAVPGPAIVDGLKKAVAGRKDRACLLIAEMSSEGNLADTKYKEATVEIASKHEDFVIGFICTSKVSSNPAHIHFTPGVKLQPGKDNLGQQYLTPDDVIGKRGCDVIIVGRGITESANRIEAAKQFSIAAWMAYNKRLHSKYN